jgi:hypothetical protein
VAAVEKAFKLALVTIFVGIHRKRNAAGALRFPMNALLDHACSRSSGSDHAHARTFSKQKSGNNIYSKIK